jgi:GntR family transcriptional regulator
MAEPMYRQIARELRQRITSGELGPGQQLPTELALCELHGASRNTIRDAIKWLTTNGLVETRPGQGTFVMVRLAPFITTLSADPETGLGWHASHQQAAGAFHRRHAMVPADQLLSDGPGH